MEQPVYYWDPNIAPSGLAFYTGNAFPAWKGSLFVGGLGSTALVRLVVEGEKVVGEERFLQENKERIRDVVQGPDGNLYLLIDTPAGRGGGPAQPGRILKLSPKK
jgi:glucose/arabinose dehydrogenase